MVRLVVTHSHGFGSVVLLGAVAVHARIIVKHAIFQERCIVAIVSSSCSRRIQNSTHQSRKSIITTVITTVVAIIVVWV